MDAALDRDADPWSFPPFFDDDGIVVGFGGFKGPPSARPVETGYAIAPSRRGRGIATTATLWMSDGVRDGRVEVVVAHALAEVDALPQSSSIASSVDVDTTADRDGGVSAAVHRWARPQLGHAATGAMRRALSASR